MNHILIHLWAKSDPFHPLLCHLIDVGNVGLSLLEAPPFQTVSRRFATASGCPEEQASRWLAYLAALHDLGKCHPRFQAKGPDHLLAPLIAAGLIKEPDEQPFRHEVVSGQWVRRHLIRTHQWNRNAALTVATALKAHHGSFRAEELSAEESPTEEALWEPLRAELATHLQRIFQPAPWKADFKHHSVAGMLLCGLIVLSDWIASNRELFTLTHAGETPEEYARRSREEARKAVSRLGFEGSAPWTVGQPFRTVWPKIESPNGLQRRVEEIALSGAAPGLAIIEAPMGEGKTEAAVYLATQWMAATGRSGLYIALPTAATSNQMYLRIREFLEQHDPAAATAALLVHGTAWMLDEATPEQLPELHGTAETEEGEVLPSSESGMALDWFRPRKRTLLALNGVGTIDQAHMSILHVPFGFLRLFGLSGKVLIIDEVHAYDAYMSEFLEHLLRWCSALEVPVILLSATLPASRRQSLIRAYAPTAPECTSVDAYPLITLVGQDGSVKHESGFEVTHRPVVRVVKHPGLLGHPDRIAEKVADRVRDGGCIGVIANTVSSAQAIFTALKERLSGDEVELILFHARFPVERRIALEQAVLDRLDKRSLLEPSDRDYRPRPRRLVLVATQVVEQSLDLDFDELFTELAPIDLLLQRMGRLWRHNREDRQGRAVPVLHVIMPESLHDHLGPSQRVYSPYILRRTGEVLLDHTEISGPSDLRKRVEDVYGFQPREDSPWWNDWLRLQQELEDDRAKARIFLIPDPVPTSFKLANFDEPPRDENEGDAAHYMAVRTRQGDYTRSVLALDGDDFREALSGRRPPGRDVLKAIYLRSISLPNWWLDGVTPAPGYEPLAKQTWLPGQTIMRLQGGRWVGITPKGERFAIMDDPVLGFRRVVEEGA